MDSIGERIKNRREFLGMSQEDLAKKLGYKSRSSINKFETDGRSLPQSKIVAIAKALLVTPSYIMGWVNEAGEEIIKKDEKRIVGVKIPVLGEVAAGIPIEAIEDIIDYEEISEDMARRGEFFGLRINGDSMLPRICKGDVVIVKQQSDAETGDTVIVRINGDSATCKRLRKYADGAIELISTNPSHEPMFYSVDQIKQLPVEIIGKVVENRQKY